MKNTFQIQVVRRKVPGSLPLLAQLLTIGRIVNSPAPTQTQIIAARKCVAYLPDAYLLAEAMQAQPDWFVTHDKEHFLNRQQEIQLPFEIGTPGDYIQRLKTKSNIF
jgi:predicted nucleic acid-binding protein